MSMGMRVRVRVSAMIGHGFILGFNSSLVIYTPIGYIASMNPENKKAMLNRLRRIEGQVRGLAAMIEGDRYCIDVVTQVRAVRAALRKVEDQILQDHVAHCVEGAIMSGDRGDQRQKADELLKLLTTLED